MNLILLGRWFFMLKTEKVQLEIKEETATISINRPERRNALDGEVWAGLEEAALKVKQSPEVKVVILTGAGKAFCAGLDLKAAAIPGGLSMGVTFRDGIETLQHVSHVFSLYEKLPVPVIVAIKGACMGAGMELALAGDIRISADNAVFSIPEVVYGLVPDAGGTQRLPRLVGPGMAKELILTGRKIDAGEALRIGLVNHVYSEETLMEKASEMANEIISLSPEAVQAAKRALNMSMNSHLEAGLQYETAAAERVLGDKLNELFKGDS